MCAIVTGQVGVDKGPYLEAVKATARARGIDLEVCHVGQMMYAEAPDVPAGRILNIPIARLNTLRRSVFKEILRTADQHEHVWSTPTPLFAGSTASSPRSISTR